ncbi:RNA recognition motif domain-containing protein [Dethiosulfatarculus sandiegensis]|uniref:RNA-binding protein n=1 Tax=Dethiosulfatarculus sandiegensis TaxID=1429043 RepID=A0A0D2JSQ1_9BACT|nr:RNA-binding protein [Dethiosulfatarculus sandiegensis]KIX12495.1 RNA-binding protein [Dethiosulfatarculus sandiegensis]
MGKSIYVGNLSYSSTEDELRELFEQFGEVHSARVISDRETGKSRGFGFVEMASVDAELAIESVNGTVFAGRTLRVNEARPREPRPPRRW